MPTKAERRVPLPTGLLPLLSQKQLETYYGVSDWTVRQWIEAGMPREPFGARGFRFDLDKVRDWMAEHGEQLAASA
jgi:phage terminase Nu1 subunit (DNA packaging protein)